MADHPQRSIGRQGFLDKRSPGVHTLGMWTNEETSRWERNLRAMVRSAGDNDPEAFAELVRMAEWLNGEGLRTAYAKLQAEGFSARDIARPLPCSYQAAHARFKAR